MIRFRVEGEPKPAGSKDIAYSKSGTAYIRDSSGDEGAKWRKLVTQIAMVEMVGRQPLQGALGMQLTFFRRRPKDHIRRNGLLKDSAPEFPHVRPDTLKLARAVEDALTAIVYRDDAQIVFQIAEKVYGEPEGVLVEVWEMGSGREA